jgi:hypothetical protein
MGSTMQNWRTTLRHLKPVNQRRFLRYCRWLRVQERFFLRRRMLPLQATCLAGLFLPFLFLLQ